MSMDSAEIAERKAVIKELACDAFEVEPEELAEHTLFDEDLGVDSLNAIDLLAALEKRFGVEIDQVDLSQLTSLATVYEFVAGELGWETGVATAQPVSGVVSAT
ncbi:acyl carrier protein [Saccharothrix sp. AJ9571]|nr:acyl carrier protein [Saccharothrix sp. AJ9571]